MQFIDQKLDERAIYTLNDLDNIKIQIKQHQFIEISIKTGQKGTIYPIYRDFNLKIVDAGYIGAKRAPSIAHHF